MNGRETVVSGPNGSAVTGTSNRIRVSAIDGSNDVPLTPGPLDAYPAWLDARTIIFARSNLLSESSQIVSVSLDGREHVQSPLRQYFVEPKPQPGGLTYGATMESGTELHLVKISRKDGALLASPTTSEFVIDRLAIPATYGSSFTVAWMLAYRAVGTPSRPLPYLDFLLGITGILILVLSGIIAYRRSRQKN
jgi:hypothetical protein